MEPAPSDLEQDRAYCRNVLPRVSRTFAVNIGLLGRPLRESVCVAYLLCRAADTLEDSWPGGPQAMRERFERFLAALAGDPAAGAALAAEADAHAQDRADVAMLAQLPRVLAVHRALPDADRDAITECVRTLASGMSRYAARAAERGPDVSWIDDEAELREYCWIVAGCVGAMLTRLFETRIGPEEPARRELRRALAPTVGEALQLTNILLDWPSDVRSGRCFVPATWLARHGLSPRALTDPREPAARELALRLEGLAHAALDRVPDYLETLPSRMLRVRLFCIWPAMWARASLRLAHREPRFPWAESRPKLSRGELFGSAAWSLLSAHDARGVRRLLGAAALPPSASLPS